MHGSGIYRGGTPLIQHQCNTTVHTVQFRLIHLRVEEVGHDSAIGSIGANWAASHVGVNIAVYGFEQRSLWRIHNVNAPIRCFGRNHAGRLSDKNVGVASLDFYAATPTLDMDIAIGAGQAEIGAERHKHVAIHAYFELVRPLTGLSHDFDAVIFGGDCKQGICVGLGGGGIVVLDEIDAHLGIERDFVVFVRPYPDCAVAIDEDQTLGAGPGEITGFLDGGLAYNTGKAGGHAVDSKKQDYHRDEAGEKNTFNVRFHDVYLDAIHFTTVSPDAPGFLRGQFLAVLLIMTTPNCTAAHGALKA